MYLPLKKRVKFKEIISSFDSSIDDLSSESNNFSYYKKKEMVTDFRKESYELEI